MRICTSILEIDRRSEHNPLALLDAVADFDLGPKVAYFSDLAAVRGTQQFQYTTCGTRQHSALRASPRQNTNPEQDTQEDFG